MFCSSKHICLKLIVSTKYFSFRREANFHCVCKNYEGIRESQGCLCLHSVFKSCKHLCSVFLKLVLQNLLHYRKYILNTIELWHYYITYFWYFHFPFRIRIQALFLVEVWKTMSTLDFKEL